MTQAGSNSDDLQAADAFLAACVRAALEAKALPLWPDDLDGSLTRSRIDFHGIAGVLAAKSEHLSKWPNDIIETIRSEARIAALWEETHKAALIPLLERLGQIGVETVLLKGTALAYRHYPDPSWRRRGDTDLLIRPEALGSARSALMQLGFVRRDDPHGLYFQETWLSPARGEFRHSIDLHWEVADRPVLQRALPSKEFRRSATPLPRLGEDAFAPDPVLMLIHGAVNEAWHQARGFETGDGRMLGGNRLIWAMDYAYIANDLVAADWERLATICSEAAIGPIVADALSGANQTLGTAITEDVMAKLELQPVSPALDYINTLDGIANLKADLRAASFDAKLRLISSALFAPRRHLVAKYPDLASRSTFALQLRRYRDALKRW